MVLNYHSVNPDAAPQLTMPVAVGNFGTTTTRWKLRDIEFPPSSGPAVGQLLPRISNTTNSMTGQPLRARRRSRFRWSTAPGSPTRRPRRPGAPGTGVPRGGPGRCFGGRAEAETVVLLRRQHAERSGRRPDGARSISGRRSWPGCERGPAGANVTVVTGPTSQSPRRRRPRRPPRPPRPPRQQGHHTTVAPTTTTTTTTTAPPPPSSEFSAPTPRPRHSPVGSESCTPSGGEGP